MCNSFATFACVLDKIFDFCTWFLTLDSANTFLVLPFKCEKLLLGMICFQLLFAQIMDILVTSWAKSVNSPRLFITLSTWVNRAIVLLNLW